MITLTNPTCARCRKPVDTMVVDYEPRAERIHIRVECHGEFEQHVVDTEFLRLPSEGRLGMDMVFRGRVLPAATPALVEAAT